LFGYIYAGEWSVAVRCQKTKKNVCQKKMENMRVRAGFCSCRVFCVVCYSLLQANSVCDQKKSGKEKSKQGLALYLVLLQCVADQFSVVLQFCQKKKSTREN